MAQPIQIIHIITDLDTGGAEMMLLKLLGSMNPDRFTNRVISLTGDGAIGEKIRGLSLETEFLRMNPRSPSIGAFLRLCSMLRRQSPDVVQTWMYHADLLGGLAAKLAGGTPVLWNLRNLNLDPAVTRRSTLWVVKVCAWLSGWLPDYILTNAWAAADVHIQRGYHADKFRVVSNGFNTDSFRPDPEARTSVRNELGILMEQPLVGMVARFDPLKDHRTFFKAAAIVHRELPDAIFMLCGQGVDWQNQSIADWVDQAGLRDAVRLLGPRQDISRLMAAMDVAVLSSVGEAFANVIGEAMACGIPCVVTDVGDSAHIVGNTGVVVPVQDANALADGICNILERTPEGRAALGRQARERIVKHFSLSAIASQYEALYEQAVKHHLRGASTHS